MERERERKGERKKRDGDMESGSGRSGKGARKWEGSVGGKGKLRKRKVREEMESKRIAEVGGKGKWAKRKGDVEEGGDAEMRR